MKSPRSRNRTLLFADECVTQCWTQTSCPFCGIAYRFPLTSRLSRVAFPRPQPKVEQVVSPAEFQTGPCETDSANCRCALALQPSPRHAVWQSPKLWQSPPPAPRNSPHPRASDDQSTQIPTRRWPERESPNRSIQTAPTCQLGHFWSSNRVAADA